MPSVVPVFYREDLTYQEYEEFSMHFGGYTVECFAYFPDMEDDYPHIALKMIKHQCNTIVIDCRKKHMIFDVPKTLTDEF